MATNASPRPARGTPRPRRMREELRALALRLHFYVGLFIAPFLLVTAATGILYALTPQLELIVYDQELHVDAAEGATAVPLAQQIDAARAEVPDGTVTEIRPSADAGSTTRVMFDSPSAQQDRQLTAFVNPYTGDVTGVLNTFGEWLPLRTWFDDLHRNLHLGDAGRWYSELAASWLWVLALSGLLTWVTRTVRRRSIRTYLLPQRTGSQRQRSVSLHASIGVWACIGLIFLSATGLTWSQYAGGNVGDLRSALNWDTPVVATDLASTPEVAQTDVAATAENLLPIARDHGLSGPVKVVPGSDGGPWTISQVQRSWPSAQDSLSVDPSTGEVLDVVRFQDWPLAAKLARWGVDGHMGLLFGWPNQVVLIAFAASLIALIVLGYGLWWRRRPKGPRRWTIAPLGRRVDSAGAYGLFIVAAAIVGLVLPLLGVSLIVFVFCDLARRVVPVRPSSR
ncbi:PepSY-associated TM helix domain-containing protein [Brachybacterium paraconglomeratum]|uniref:PepSY-associated TM helix domain-containing protein n=1 Tax=Brachybacterium paraconglomeratum TaxID=173362 RepID=UPI0037C9CFFC